eukprot:Phypoly_transcript_01840.p1 GENE.Phypoly_transcript_01840~~Phypoly_transcript_01840.p1  ORF type:complete len:982 (+),score=166.31 Phypoly_transcript_01840:80-2947(+)
MEKAKELKEQGNQFYKQEKFLEALKHYVEASELQPNDPVYQSNISAVQYEIGQYADAVRTIDAALTLLAPPNASNPQLAARLLLRKAKSLFYSKKFEESKKALDQLTRECESAGIANLDTDGVLAKALNQVTPEYTQFSICRSGVDTRAPEYYIVGHDRPVSAFAGHLTQDQYDLLRDTQDNEEHRKLLHELKLKASRRIHFNTDQDNFAFLFGGIGDARHLFESLSELNDLCPAPTTKKFHFTLVDVKPTVIARDLVMFYIFKLLSRFSSEQMKHDIEAIEILALAHYAYLGTALPDYLHEKLMKVIEELISDLEKKSLPPWIYVQEDSIPRVLEYLYDWKDFKKSAKFMLGKTQGKVSDMVQNMLSNDIRTKGLVPEGFEDPSKVVKEQMSKMTDEELMELPIPGKTPAEKRFSLNEFFASTDGMSLAESMNNLSGTTEESGSYKITRVLYPPQVLLDRHPEIKELRAKEAALSRRLREKIKEEKENWNNQAESKPMSEKEYIADEEPPDEATYKAVGNHVFKKFKANPLFWDKWWVEVIGEEDFEFAFSPFDAVSNICGEMYPAPTNPTCLFDYISILYEKIAGAIAKFGEKNIILEWVAGDVYKTCLEISNSKDERLAKGFAISYDRIYLSNIPDYVGGNLPIAIFCSPLMKPMPHAYIGYNILLNTGVFKNYEECVRTYTLLNHTSDHQRYLGMKHIHGDLWGEDPNWSVLDCPLPVDQLVSQEELVNWLHRIFFYIVLPPARSPMSKFRVDHPLNLLAFVTLLNRLAEVGYPRHWLATVLDNLLSGKIKTKGRPPPNSLNVHYSATTLTTVPFLVELEYAAAACANHLAFPLLSPLPALQHIVMTKEFLLDPRDDQRACVVALMFAPRAAFLPVNMPKELQNLRDNLHGDPKVYLVSSLHWDSVNSKVEFFASEERIAQMVRDDWYAGVVRLDSYKVLMKPVSLKTIVK